jgi:hypothetical protein
MNFLDRADAVARRLEQFIAGSGPADPLYLTNRSRGQKFRLALLVGTPVLVVAVLVVLALGNFFDSDAPPKAAPVAKPGELTANVLPDLAKTYHSDSDPDCEVIEAGVAAQTLSGKVRNDTDHLIHVADLVFDVTDDTGSQLGAVAVRVESIAPRATVAFHQPLPQHNAQTALVREIHTR